ncbi:MAG TPA: alpha/beta hydrolase [Xanthobacteraceae bacterium]|nr:alpha/beta hydrolase [Xanthobacteraceae bacterium]
MAIDYEVEYDNRARVPEHPEILGRMAKEAAAYRDAAIAAGRAALDVSYGSSPRQIVDIFDPPDGGTAPLAVFVHGGYWRALAPAAFSQVAAGLNTRGMTVALAGYDLCPQVGIGEIIEQIRQACLFLWRRTGRCMLVFGHSAGGHLAATSLATDWAKYGAPADLVPAAMAISGLFDLVPLTKTAMNVDFKMDEAMARKLSPLTWPAPDGKTLDAVVGGDESSEFLRQSRIITEIWGADGVTTRFEAVPGANHFTVIEPLADPNSAMVARLLELLPK